MFISVIKQNIFISFIFDIILQKLIRLCSRLEPFPKISVTFHITTLNPEKKYYSERKARRSNSQLPSLKQNAMNGIIRGTLNSLGRSLNLLLSLKTSTLAKTPQALTHVQGER